MAPLHVAAFLPEADFFRKFGAPLGVIGRHHGIIRRQSPARAVFVWSQAKCGAQVPFQHLQFAPVFQTDDVVRRDRPANGYRWLASRFFRPAIALLDLAQGGTDSPDDFRYLIY